jgi:hypothetical protein
MTILNLTLLGTVEATDRPGFIRAVVMAAGGRRFDGDGRTTNAAIRAACRKAGRSFDAFPRLTN